jgi:hypothetical protein
MFEQVARHRATCRLKGADADEQRAFVGSAHCAFGELATDVVWFRVAATGELLPDLFLTGVVVGHRERHQLFQRHAVTGVEVEEFLGNCGKLQPLLDNGRAHKKPSRDVLFAQALLAQGLERPELVERMQGLALDVFGERILLREATGPHHARHRLGLVHALLLDEKFERPEPAAARGDLEHAGFLTLGIEHRPDTEALQQRTPGDVVSQFLDRDAGLHAPHIGLAEHQLVEGDVARRAQRDLLNRSHVDVLHDGRPRAFLSTSNPSRTDPPSSHSSAAGPAGPGMLKTSAPAAR